MGRRAAASVHVTDEGYAALGGDEHRVVNKERLRVNGATHYCLRDITGNTYAQPGIDAHNIRQTRFVRAGTTNRTAPTMPSVTTTTSVAAWMCCEMCG